MNERARSKPFGPAPTRRGVTLTELLVVLIIVSILATIAVPVFTNASERARVSAAWDECATLAKAQEACAAIHGFYVPLQVLDDLPGRAGLGNLTGDSDAIGNETGIFLIDINQDVTVTGQRAISDTFDPRVRDLVENWQGPFVTFQRYYIDNARSADPQDVIGVLNRLDFPLDPWGNPYRFYAPRGIVGSAAASTNPASWNSVSFSDGLINAGEDRFDRYAIVSFGPDGVPNNRSNPRNTDDIIYYFGSVKINPTETGFTPVIVPTP